MAFLLTAPPVFFYENCVVCRNVVMYIVPHLSQELSAICSVSVPCLHCEGEKAEMGFLTVLYFLSVPARC